ncbi:MAG TPA: YdcF family protein [Bryobacteraceae bacterium]|nr:YdcF family protein [Bryobacteraceae bacterium]
MSCRRKMMRAVGLLALALLVLACALWLFRTPLLTFAGRFLVNNETPRKADAILVLGGDDFGRRILKAAQLANQGYASSVLVSGPSSLIGHESDATIQFAEQNGYPASLFHAVWLPPGTDSTRSEATFLGKYLKTHGINRILLVTSNYHTGRAARLWRTQAPWIAITVIAASDPFFTPGGWWKTRSGQKTFLFEWMKTVSTWLGN